VSEDELVITLKGPRLDELRALAYILTIKRARSAGELHDEVSELQALTIAVAHELAYQKAAT
jgi:hypothetical protein